jgi:hypothetical protein
MKTLPESCMTRNMTGTPIIIKRDVEGYYATMADDAEIDAFNKEVGADEEVVRIMTCASMFGWSIPAVAKYEASE